MVEASLLNGARPGLFVRFPETDDMALVKGTGSEPIPGYRLLEPLGRGGFGEVWKCEAPGGIFKAIKFVGGDTGLTSQQAEQEWEALQRIKSIRHPFLLAMDRVELVDGELVLVMELADTSLADLLAVAQEAGDPGLPREEVLGYLSEAAEVLDLINLEHNLQHLDIKPANLFVINHHVKVADFGLLKGLVEEGETAAGPGVTPLYGAPEVLEGQVSGRSDQYSLAVVYLELRTGQLPFHGETLNALMVQRATAAPDVSALPEEEQGPVARALSRMPENRFPSCQEFLRALGPQTTPRRSTVDLLAQARKKGPGARRTQTPRRDTDPQTLADAATRPVAVAFAGHRLFRNIPSNPLGEVWKAEGPDGRERLIKFPAHVASGDPVNNLNALQLIASITHPGVLGVEVLVGDGERLALAFEPYTKTLADVCRQVRTTGHPGIPREEMLGYLECVAETLDTLAEEQGLRHLMLNPRTLVFDGPQIVVSDVGLAQLFLLPSGEVLGPLNGRYAPPELYSQGPAPNSDQYSLAVIYQEMLTGTFPYRTTPTRGRSQAPNVDLLPAPDRGPIIKALQMDPNQRYPSCMALIESLQGTAGRRGRKVAVPETAVLAPVIPAPTPGSNGPVHELPPAAFVVETLFAAATGGGYLHHSDSVRYVIDPNSVLRHQCGARLSTQLVRLKLEGFCQHWSGKMSPIGPEAYRLLVPLPMSLWERCLGREPALELAIHLAAPSSTASLTQVEVAIRPLHCPEGRMTRVMTEQAPQLLQSLRTFLQVESERRRLARVPFRHPLGVFPVRFPAELGQAIVCQGKDISLQGIGLYAPEKPPSPYLYIQSLLTPELSQVALLARVVRVEASTQGSFEVGMCFIEEPETWSLPKA